MLILKIIGFTLLGVLALLLLLILLVLFVPVRYSASFNKQAGEMSGTARVTWLLGLVSLKIKYEGKKFVTRGRVAFVKLFKDRKEPEEKNAKAADKKTAKIEDQHFKSLEKQKKQHEQKENKAKKTGTHSEPKPGLSVVDRLKNIYTNREKVEDLWEDTRPVVMKAIKKVKKLLLHIVPKRSGGVIEFGFDDPSATGKLLGAVSAIYGLTGPLFGLRPDFENKVLNCDIWIKGRIRIFTVALILVLLYFNKELKNAGKRLKALSERV